VRRARERSRKDPASRRPEPRAARLGLLQGGTRPGPPLPAPGPPAARAWGQRTRFDINIHPHGAVGARQGKAPGKADPRAAPPRAGGRGHSRTSVPPPGPGPRRSAQHRGQRQPLPPRPGSSPETAKPGPAPPLGGAVPQGRARRSEPALAPPAAEAAGGRRPGAPRLPRKETRGNSRLERTP